LNLVIRSLDLETPFSEFRRCPDGEKRTLLKMTWRHLVLSICFIGSMCESQSPPRVAKRGDIHSISELQSRLLSGNEDDRSQLSEQLRLMIPKWTRVGATKDVPCTVFDSVRPYDANFSSTIQGVLLEVYSSTCQYTFLTVLQHLPSGDWRYIDTQPFWSQDHEPKVNLESLVEEGTKEIVVDGYLVDKGTGIYQTNYAVLKLLQDKLRVVLDEPLRVTYAVAPATSEKQSQESSFRITRMEANNKPSTSFRCILEEQVLKNGKFGMTRRWLHIWIPEKQIFEAILSD